MAKSVSRTSSSPAEGPEYKAMRECNAMMVELLQSSIGSLGDALFGRELIPLDIKRNLSTTTQSNENGTRNCIEHILSKVKYTPQVFHLFVDVLKEQNLHHVADQLQLFQKKFQTATPQPSLSLPPHTSQNQSVPSTQLRATPTQPNTDAPSNYHKSALDYTLSHTNLQIPWDNDPNYAQGTIGTTDVILLVSKVSGDNIVPRRTKPSLTEEEKHKLQQQGIHEDCCHSDLSIMITRHDRDKRTTSGTVLIVGEKTTCEEVKQRIAELFNTTDKEGVKLHYIGPGERESGNWCFKDGVINFEEMTTLYIRYLKPRGRVLTIVSDCSYSGRWVKEAMTFMDEQEVGPCGHQAKEKKILVKMYASCLANEIPTELVYSTHCVENNKDGAISYSIRLRGEKMHDNQCTSGIDFTALQCKHKIDQPCTMAPGSTWQQWNDAQRIYAVSSEDEGQPAWYCLLLKDDEDKIKEWSEKARMAINPREYGQILISGWGEHPPEITKKWIEHNYYVNYNYVPTLTHTTD